MAIKELREATSPKANKEILDVSFCCVLRGPQAWASTPPRPLLASDPFHCHSLGGHVSCPFSPLALVGISPSRAFSYGEDSPFPFCHFPGDGDWLSPGSCQGLVSVPAAFRTCSRR